MSRRAWSLACLGLLPLWTSAAAAQGPWPEGSLSAPVEAAATGRVGAAGKVSALQLQGADTLPCPQCDPRKQFWPGLAAVAVAQAIPTIVSKAINHEEWAYVNWQTIKNNFVYPWQWDDNAFLNNQFAHPYQGGLYYNAGRVNGYDFWASGLWAAGGSLMWEYFLEAWAPAPNDFINTTLGGVILGEALYRASRLPLDNTATGAGRTWREIGSLVLNPVSGVTRAIRGEWGEVSANPPDWRPSAVLGVLDVGYRNITQSVPGSTDQRGETQLNATFLLSYGNPVQDLHGTPFSYFAIRADLAGPSEGSVLNQLTARGSLAAWPIDGSRHNQLALFLEYDYFDNPAFTYGGTGAQGGLVTSFGAPGNTWWGQTQILVNGVILGAVQSDYYAAVEGRNYDYGPGLGTLLSGRVLYKDRLQATVGYTGLSLFTVDGAESTHYQDATLLELRYWTSRRIALGTSYISYSRQSEYEGLPGVEHFASFVRIFLSSAFPRLP